VSSPDLREPKQLDAAGFQGRSHQRDPRRNLNFAANEPTRNRYLGISATIVDILLEPDHPSIVYT